MKIHNVDKAKIVPQQITYEHETIRPIRNNLPMVIYLPADPDRRRRLLKNIARINRERATQVH